MKVAVQDLAGAALDWSVAVCEGGRWDADRCLFVWAFLGIKDAFIQAAPPYSSSWQDGGPIIEREGLTVRTLWLDGRRRNGEDAYRVDLDFHEGRMTLGELSQYGPTPLVAAMRCYVAYTLGDHVELPDEVENH